ncbi:MAG: DUF1564 domain-containing protein [Leptospira sp.]|nr:DUF1564 domain-containing protein [Leptospira sp.]
MIIPEELYVPFVIRAMSVGGAAKYLRRLLNEYRFINFSGDHPVAERAKILYQAKGLNLKRVSFRPRNEDWIELKLIAQAHGVSATRFFVILLELDFSEFGDAVGDVFRDVDPSIILARPLVFKLSLYKNDGIRVRKFSFGRRIFQFNIS